MLIIFLKSLLYVRVNPYQPITNIKGITSIKGITGGI